MTPSTTDSSPMRPGPTVLAAIPVRARRGLPGRFRRDAGGVGNDLVDLRFAEPEAAQIALERDEPRLARAHSGAKAGLGDLRSRIGGAMRLDGLLVGCAERVDFGRPPRA